MAIRRSRKIGPPILGVLLLIVVLLAPTAAGASGSLRFDPRITRLDVIALGDSYSAGVGAGAPVGECGRTGASWAVACGGATVASVSATQLPSVDSSRNVATITVGGNDIGFSRRVVQCVIGTCSAESLSIRPDSGTWFELRAKLTDLYMRIRSRMAQGGHLFVMTYPIFFGIDADTCAGFTTGEQAAANAMVTKLDDVIANAVSDANRRLGGFVESVHLVDWRPKPALRIRNGYTVPPGSTGAGTTFDTFEDRDFGVCNTRGNLPSVSGLTWHPTAQGYFRAAGRFFSTLRLNQPPALA